MTDVIVVGGGLAGITAALDLADRGNQVTLLESRARLGGLTHSFRRDGYWVDNGQHVFLRCCTAYRGLLQRLHVQDQVTLQPRLQIVMRSETTGRTHRMSRGALPAPLHLAGALMRHRWITPAERVRAARAALRLGRVDRTSPLTDETSFGSWLTQQHCSTRAIETLWDLVGVATLNAHADNASLALAATVFQLGMLERADGADIGWSAVPLQQLHGDAAARELGAAGTRVLLRHKVTGLRFCQGRWQLDTADGQQLEARSIVLAVPPRAAEALVGHQTLGLPAGFAAALGSSPIVNLHLVLDRRVLDVPFLAAVDGPLQWVFDRTVPSGLTSGQYLAVSLSAADDLVRRPVAQLRDELLPHLERLLPQLRHATVREFFVTREPDATFRPAPGTARLRPAPRTDSPGLAVAGAWTATGWPATMESAVRSGHAAANVLTQPVPRTRDEVAA